MDHHQRYLRLEEPSRRQNRCDITHTPWLIFPSLVHARDYAILLYTVLYYIIQYTPYYIALCSAHVGCSVSTILFVANVAVVACLFLSTCVPPTTPTSTFYLVQPLLCFWSRTFLTSRVPYFSHLHLPPPPSLPTLHLIRPLRSRIHGARSLRKLCRAEGKKKVIFLSAWW